MRRILLSAGLSSCLILLTACGGGGANALLSTNTASAATNGTSSGTASGTTTSSTTPTSSTGTGTTSISSSGTTGSTTSGTTSTSPSTSGASTSALPTPPSTATVFDAVQNTTDNWANCTDCAGGSLAATFWTAPFQTTPSMTGSSRQFYISGPAWSSALFYKKLGAHDSASHFLWDFWVYFDSASAAQTWSAEYDLWQSMGGQEFMIGSQCDFGDGEWDLWDSLNNKWIKDSGVPCPRFTPNAWHHIQWYLERVSATQYKYVTLAVDGQAHTLNRTFTANPTNWGDNLGVQWQLDENSTGTALNEWVDKVTVTIW